MLQVALFISLAIIFAAIGDILFSKGMKRIGAVRVHHFRDVWPVVHKILTSSQVLFGGLSMMIYMGSYLAALMMVDVSVVNPLTALSYVITTAYAALIAHEHVGKRRWTGISLITLGAILVGLSS